jgi:hypothetical protein
MADLLQNLPIKAITAGSAADIKTHGTELAARIGELHPHSLTLWPDWDEPGVAAMRALSLILNRQGIPHATIKPGELGLPKKGDAVEFIEAGNSLATLIAKQTGVLEDEPVSRLARDLMVIHGQQMVWPGTREVVNINEDNGSAIWWDAYQTLPNQKQLREFLAILRNRSMRNPSLASPRIYTNEQMSWYRTHKDGLCFRISAEGITLDHDPEGVLLQTPDDGRHVDTSVDMEGKHTDLLALLSPWKMDDTEIAMITGWLVCAMGNLQTPILFMKSPAGTGKTTLARFLLSVIEPMTPEMSSQSAKDERHFVNDLFKFPASLMDNVSRVDNAVEDQLSKLVTGYTASFRPLYTDKGWQQFLRRGIIVTTTNWDIYKGDLASRCVVVLPVKREQGYYDDRSMQRQFMPLVPKVRYYIMSLLSTYYETRERFTGDTHFRVGDLGRVFACLGYDTADLARKESAARSATISGNEPWIEAIVALWKEEASISFVMDTKDVLKWMYDFGCQNVPAEKSPKLARWFAEKAPFFVDYGFTVEHQMTNPRRYRFARVEPSVERVDHRDGQGDLGLHVATVSS